MGINDAITAHPCRILVLLEQLTSQIPITETRFSYDRAAFALAGEEVNATGFVGTTVGVDFDQTNVIIFDDGRSTTISLPADILDSIMTNGTLRLTYASFKNGNLFNTAETSETLGGMVIAARVVDQSVDNLENPLTITFTKNQVSSQVPLACFQGYASLAVSLSFSLPAIMAQMPVASFGTSPPMVGWLCDANTLTKLLGNYV